MSYADGLKTPKHQPGHEFTGATTRGKGHVTKFPTTSTNPMDNKNARVKRQRRAG